MEVSRYFRFFSLCVKRYVCGCCEIIYSDELVCVLCGGHGEYFCSTEEVFKILFKVITTASNMHFCLKHYNQGKKTAAKYCFQRQLRNLAQLNSPPQGCNLKYTNVIHCAQIEVSDRKSSCQIYIKSSYVFTSFSFWEGGKCNSSRSY